MKSGKGLAEVDEVKKSLPDLKTTPVCGDSVSSNTCSNQTLQVVSWIFKNNGILFRDQDWSRLKKIGNAGNVM